MDFQPLIVFLDIDGVRLSTSTWNLPANVRLLREKAVAGHGDLGVNRAGQL